MAPEDIEAVIYNMCSESLPLETDITTFLLASCQHFRQIAETAHMDQNQKEADKEASPADDVTNRRTSVRFMEILDETDG